MIGADLVSPVTPLFLGQNLKYLTTIEKNLSSAVQKYQPPTTQPPLAFFQINDLFF
jgi:hypothetical protein